MLTDAIGEARYFDVVVAGAGVVGMACACALQRSGLSVCVADPAPAGSVCSFGNAGIIANDHVLPMARPEVLWRLPAMLASREAPLHLAISRLPALLPWMLRFAVACRQRQVMQGTRAIAALTRRALAAWEEELDASGGRSLLVQRGLYSVYRNDAAFRRDAGERQVQRELGVSWEVLDGAALRRREPALGSGIGRAVFYPEVAHVADPQGLVRCLEEVFVRVGGERVTGEVTRVQSQPHQVVVDLRGGARSSGSRARVRGRYLVIAAGLGARVLCRHLGVRVPLAAEMGYHLRFPGSEARLSAPVAAAESGFIVAPMDGHLRSAGTVDMACREAAPDRRQVHRLRSETARLFRERLPEPLDAWRGSRPILPDFLPAIGALPGKPRILAAFGHQHIGLTTAAVTGAIIRDLILGQTPALDIAPYDPGRFTFPAHPRTRPP